MTTIGLKSLRKQKVVDTSTAETIGRVTGVTIDTSTSAIAGVTIKGRHSGVIPFPEVIGFTSDAVTVPDASVVVEDVESLPTDSDAYRSRLLDDAGNELGKVEDLGVDEDGRIVWVSAGGTNHPGRLLGIGSYAVVIAR